MGSIHRVTDIMGEISAASTQQSAAAAESLRQLAQQLVQAVAVFKLSASAHG